MNRENFINDYWQYYLLLEKKFINSIKYVELNQSNFLTFSNEFANELLSIGSEMDVFMKVISGFSQIEKKNISDYASVILNNYMNIVDQEVIINYKVLTIKPFEGWNLSNPSRSLFWWENYNKVKHGRVINYSEANMKNVLYSLAGLFLLEMHYLRSISTENEPDIPDNDHTSKLFTLSNWETKWLSTNFSMLLKGEIIE